jgi:hypothetical protein
MPHSFDAATRGIGLAVLWAGRASLQLSRIVNGSQADFLSGAVASPKSRRQLRSGSGRAWTVPVLGGPGGTMLPEVIGLANSRSRTTRAFSSIKTVRKSSPVSKRCTRQSHTVGHTSFVINSGSKSLFLTGNLMHHVILTRTSRSLRPPSRTQSPFSSRKTLRWC